MADAPITNARCPTCGHMHPHRMGLAMCMCEDCALLWTSVRREHLAPEYQERYDRLWGRVSQQPEDA